MSAVPKIHEDLLTLREAAARLNKSPQTLRNWLSAGKMKRLKIGGSVYVAAAEVDKILTTAVRAGRRRA
jgi:excisionase family DNA binding protein